MSGYFYSTTQNSTGDIGSTASNVGFANVYPETKLEKELRLALANLRQKVLDCRKGWREDITEFFTQLISRRTFFVARSSLGTDNIGCWNFRKVT